MAARSRCGEAACFWLGAALPAIVESVNVVHFTMAPAFPYFPIKVDEARNITNTITLAPMERDRQHLHDVLSHS